MVESQDIGLEHAPAEQEASESISSPEEIATREMTSANRLFEGAYSRIEAMRNGIGATSLQAIRKIEEESGILSRIKDIHSTLGTALRERADRIADLATGSFDVQKNLLGVMSATREDRPALLSELKENIAKRQDGFSGIHESLFRSIMENPDISSRELISQAMKLGAPLHMTSQERRHIETLIYGYHEKHQAVRQVRERYPDDKELYTAVFGMQPKGDVEVIAGPITLNFRCSNAEDYALVHAFSSDPEHPSTTGALLANSSGVSLAHGGLIPELAGSIIAENIQKVVSENEDPAAVSEEILKHEQQHAVKRLFTKTLGSSEAGEKVDLYRLHIPGELDTMSNKEINDFIRKAAVFQREATLEMAHDEMLAYLLGEQHTPQQTIDILTSPDSSYDFTRKVDEKYVENTLGFRTPESIDVIYDVFRNEYKKILTDAGEAITELRDAGMSREKIAGLLMVEPITRWKRVSTRLIQGTQSLAQ